MESTGGTQKPKQIGDWYQLNVSQRVPRKTAQSKKPKFFNFKKETYILATDYKPAKTERNVNSGQMLLIDGEYLIPANICRRIDGEELSTLLAQIKEEEKHAMDAAAQVADAQKESENQKPAELQDESNTVRIENLPKELREKANKILNPSTDKIAKTSGNYATGAFIGGVAGIAVSMWIKKGIVTGVVITGMTALIGAYSFNKLASKK